MWDTTPKTILEQTHPATGSKVFLTFMEESHIRHLIKLVRKPDLIDSIGWNTFLEDDDKEGFIESVSGYSLPYSRKSPPIVFGVYLTQGALPIGYVALKGLNQDLLTAEIGIAILDQKYHNKGYGRLVLKRMITYAFDELQIKTIAAIILATNKQSINMVKRLGFVVKEIMYHSWPMPNGTLADMLWMEITSETWYSEPTT
jgi:RimJ/RimL family protein N-acetyltransferase